MNEQRQSVGKTNGTAGGQLSQLTGDQPMGRNLLVSMWNHKWILIATVAVALTVALVHDYWLVPEYRSASKIYIEQSGVVYIGDTMAMTIRGPLAAQAEILRSIPLLTEVLKQQEMQEADSVLSADNPILYLKDKLKVIIAESGDMMTVSMQSSHEEDNAITVNAIVRAFIEYHAVKKKSTAAQVLKILRNENKDLEQTLTEATKQYFQFQEAEGASALDEGNPVLMRYERLVSLATEADFEVVRLKNRLEHARSLRDEPDKLRELIKTDITYWGGAARGGDLKAEQLAEQLAELERQLQLISKQYGPEHYAVRRLHDEVMSRRQNQTASTQSQGAQPTWDEEYLSYLEALLAAARAPQGELTRALIDQESEVTAIRRKIMTAGLLKNDMQRIASQQDRIDQRIKDITVTGNSGVLDIWILEPATTSGRAVNVNRTRTITVALVMGLMVGIGGVFLMDYLDDRVWSVDDMYQGSSIPVLGMLPVIGGGKVSAQEKGTWAHLHPSSHVAEAVRAIRTMLDFTGTQVRGRTTLVVSAASDEGKSTVVSNLAISMAQADRQVLLIDTDCRMPALHQIFGLESDRGLSTVLGGENSFEKAVQSTSIPKLDVLVCGPIPDSPAEMVGGVRFKQLLNRLADRYDEILMDSPPLRPFADGCVIAATCHNTIMVVQAGSTQRKALNAATHDLETVGADILGIIINRAKRVMGGYDQQYAYKRRQQSKETQGNGTSSDAVQPVASTSADQPPSTS